jgi:hypothetical protein
MGNLFVIGFDEPNQAEEVHFKLQTGKAKLTVPVTYGPKERPSKVFVVR